MTKQYNNEGDKFEKITIRQLGLKAFGSGRRSNKYLPDATYDEHFFEIKSCNLSIGKVSTGRDITHKKINDWRKVHWIFSGREGSKLIKHILVTKDKMEVIYKDFEDRINNPNSKKYAGMNKIKIIEESMRSFGQSEEEIQKACNTYRRGTGLNDPRISWRKIEDIGVIVGSLEDIRRVLENEQGATEAIKKEE